MLLSRAQHPWATPSLVVRDEEAAGSNPVTPTSIIASEAPATTGEGLIYRQPKKARRTDNQMGVPVEPPSSGEADGVSVPEGAGLGVVAVIAARRATPITLSTSAA
jgi:hypothetical protein